MNIRHGYKLCTIAALTVLGTGLVLGRAAVAQQGPYDVEAGTQVLTRGPVHEAFAQTVTFNPQPGIVVSQAPPDLIEEVPPDQRPEGANVTWIPGYWGWDDERSSFLWISGTWRALPPGRQWIPGYWSGSAQGIQWTSGYWADAAVNVVQYLPAPPPTAEVGPNIAAPSPDSIWVPGSWVWYQDHYAWRPGYWGVVRPDWIWIPAHYVWAPRGYVFVDGYWDYSVNRRGVLFAPVYFDQVVYTRSNYHYSPSVVIDLSVFSDHLFLRPRYQHYYFGDYYAPSYRSSGFYASFTFNSTRYGYDPIYAHRRWENRRDRDWEYRAQADFQNRRDHEDARPPRTLAAQITRSTSGVSSREKSPVVARPFSQMTSRTNTPIRFQPVAHEERQQIVQRGQAIHAYRVTREKRETGAERPSAKQAARPTGPGRVVLPKSPIVAQSAAQLRVALPRTPSVTRLPARTRALGSNRHRPTADTARSPARTRAPDRTSKTR